jgi:hypothetical protein
MSLSLHPSILARTLFLLGLLLTSLRASSECTPYWRTSQEIAVPGGTVGAADFDGDGVPDVVGVGSSGVWVALTDAVTRNLGAPAYVSTSASLKGVEARDFTNDGMVDLVVLDTTANGLATFVGNGNGTFAAAVTTPTTIVPQVFAAGDFNGDVHLDVAVRGTDTTTLAIWLGSASGAFTAGESLALDTPVARIAVGDLTGDAKDDVLLTRSGFPGLLLVPGNGDGTLATPVEVGDGDLGAVAVADLDDDGDIDITTTEFANPTFSVLLNNGTGSFAPAGSWTTRSTEYAHYNGEAWDITLGNVTSDAVPDAILTLSADGLIATLKGIGDGTFAPATFEFAATTDLQKASPRTATLADIDGDGRNDLLYRSPSAIILTLNDCGDLTLATQVLTPIVSAGDQARVKVAATNGVAATAEITIHEGSTPLVTGLAASWNPPEIELPLLPVGTHTIHAVFEGDSFFHPTASEAVSVEVTSETTTAAVQLTASTELPVRYGRTFYLEPIVTSAIPGDPGGSLRFFIDGVPQEPVACCGSFAVFDATTGSHEYRVEYLGSSTHPPSALSEPLIVEVEPAEVTMSFSVPPMSGHGETFSVLVGTSAPGNITILDGGTVVATGTASGSDLELTLSLSLGTHQLTARYDGGANYLPVEQTHEHTVVPAAGVLSIDAHADGSSIRLNWMTSNESLVSWYVQRLVNGVWQTVTGGSTSFGQRSGQWTFTDVDPGTTYVYRMFASDWYGNNLGPSNIDAASIGVFVDETLTPRVTSIRSRHFTDVLDGVNRLRRANGAPALSFPGLAPGQPVRHQDFLELRYQANQARAALGIAYYPFTDRGSSRTILIRDLEELRNAVR